MEEEFHYAWAEGSRVKIDPQVAGEELERIREETGSLTAQVVVQQASDPTNPLSEFFEWDDSAAATKYREDQARYLIRSVTIKRLDSRFNEPVRAFVSISRGVGERPQYENTVRAMEDPFLRQQILQRAESELDSFARKYSSLKELGGVLDAIEAQLLR